MFLFTLAVLIQKYGPVSQVRRDSGTREFYSFYPDLVDPVASYRRPGALASIQVANRLLQLRVVYVYYSIVYVNPRRHRQLGVAFLKDTR